MADNKNSHDGMHLAVSKMLEALGLHIKLRRFGRSTSMPGFSSKSEYARQFIDANGNVLRWWNDNPMLRHKGIIGNGILGGEWTVFDDSDDATFSLFTEKVKCFSMSSSDCLEPDPTEKCINKDITNPFYGCKSIEEVLMTCDLMAS